MLLLIELAKLHTERLSPGDDLCVPGDEKRAEGAQFIPTGLHGTGDDAVEQLAERCVVTGIEQACRPFDGGTVGHGHSAAPNAVNEAAQMVNRGGKICLAAFPHEAPAVDIAHLVRNNIYLYGIRGEGKTATHRAEAFMRQKRFDATLIHTHTFDMDDLKEAIRYAKDRVEDAIKVVVKNKHAASQRAAAE